MLTWVKTMMETKTRVMILAPAEERPALPFPFQSHSPLSLSLVYFPLCYFPSSSALSLSPLLFSLNCLALLFA
jgi:hypothetical protein